MIERLEQRSVAKLETAKLKKFAQYARRSLLEQVSTKLKLVLAENSIARRENTDAIRRLEEAIKTYGKDQVLERVAYIWFNRFCALRFMDVNRFTRIGVVSPAEGQVQPEILAEAKMGHIDEELVHDKIRQQIFSLLDGKAPSHDSQGEAYRLLVVAACNYWNKAMPFLFQHIDDYTELLMPDDLLSDNSILGHTRESMTSDVCEDVEVIGWLYQFYISEKKDEVFDGLKKNQKITPENIPAATQLFTPHWIVRYLVENSLGRLWLLNRPDSKLVEQMDYYIKPEQPEKDFLRISSPEEIKICDPACGSGHMLTYAFDLLYAIYEEEGYEPAEIPEKILTHNLYGIEIDERAGELAAFALTMKARGKHRRFFNKGVNPNICVLENVHFEEGELNSYMDFVGRELFTAPLLTTLRLFEEADNFGSLIRPDVTEVAGMLKVLESKNVSGKAFLSMTHQKVLQSLRQADYLSPKYHVVVANPPYMGNRSMNSRLQIFSKEEFPESKLDLFAMFIERNGDLAVKRGSIAMITMQSWMFLSSFEKLRDSVLSTTTLLSMIHLGPRAFDSIGGEVVSTTAFVFSNVHVSEFKGMYIRLVDQDSEVEKRIELQTTIENSVCSAIFRASMSDFKKVPGSPIAYWLSDKTREAFVERRAFGVVAETRKGMVTARNEIYVRQWYEVGLDNVKFDTKTRSDARESGKKWFPYIKGGTFRKWYGNKSEIVNWENDGHQLRTTMHPTENRVWATNFNLEYIFKPNVNWSDITGGSFSARTSFGGEIFDATGLSCFPSTCDFENILAFLNSSVASYFLMILNPTLHYQAGNIASLPEPGKIVVEIPKVNYLIELERQDWDSFETSWNFLGSPLVERKSGQTRLSNIFLSIREVWREAAQAVQSLEEENNRLFIKEYGLQNELTPDVPLNEITLTCNPHYRYGNDKSEEELEALLLADTVRELVSYAVGCMFGRYSLDKPGLILANQGETIQDYLNQVPESNFPADDDNVIPMLDGDWFTDDITERFREFLRVAFGEEHYEENIKFVEQGLNIKGKRNYSIRDYLLNEFYNDHVKRYKKRPIYWLFSSPKGSFNALIYMHRYRPDTVSVVLNDYLREFRTKLNSHKNHLEAVSRSASASQTERTKALKEIEKVKKMIVEMEDYERDVLYPLATEQVEIDLDDGVKVNYPMFGAALKKIAGLEAKDD